MAVSEAQLTMCRYYHNGSTGVLISGLVWVIAAVATYLTSFQTGIISFFFGGMLIFPISAAFAKLFHKNRISPDKALSKKAIYSLPILFAGLLISFSLSKTQPNLFFPIMSIAIGLRYFTFQNIYGLRIYSLLGIILVILGVVGLATGDIYPSISAALVGGVEILFAGIVLNSHGRKKPSTQ